MFLKLIHTFADIVLLQSYTFAIAMKLQNHSKRSD